MVRTVLAQQGARPPAHLVLDRERARPDNHSRASRRIAANRSIFDMGGIGRRLAGAVLVGSVVLLLAGAALPVAEGLWIIPASVAIGLSLAAVALGALRAPTPVTVPDSMTAAAVR